LARRHPSTLGSCGYCLYRRILLLAPRHNVQNAIRQGSLQFQRLDSFALQPEIERAIDQYQLAWAEEADWRISSPTRRRGTPRCGFQEVQLKAAAVRIIGGQDM
jgi:hypothetical protein